MRRDTWQETVHGPGSDGPTQFDWLWMRDFSHRNSVTEPDWRNISASGRPPGHRTGGGSIPKKCALSSRGASNSTVSRNGD